MKSTGTSLRLFLGLSLALAAGMAPAQSVAPPAAPASQPQVVALLAAIGDRIEIVRQKRSTGSNIEPFTRKRLNVDGQALNFAVLRGLDAAIAEEQPEAQRVLLKWTAPAEMAQKLEQAPGREREEIMMDAVLAYLRTLPQRSEWDRIELIVPSYFFSQMRGMGGKLSGIGFYVQPLSNTSVEFDDNGSVSFSDADGDRRTVNPRTGETNRSSTYIAPFMYYQRLTLDARTLEVLARKRQFDNTKYADPLATGIDISQQMPLELMVAKLIETVERSAYQSVRGTRSEVKVSAPQVVTEPAAASAPR